MGLVCALYGCAQGTPPQAPDPTAGSRANILGGQQHVGDDAVFYLNIDFGNGEGAGCTASLVAPRVVITAKHCVCNEERGGLVQASQLSLGVGRDRQSLTGYSRVVGVRTTEGSNCLPENGDFAILILDEPGNLQPYRFGEGDDGISAGSTVTGIGYGVTDRDYVRGEQPREGAVGIKNIGQAPIEQTSDAELLVGELACVGDSGGPLFGPDGRIVGVSSRGTGENNGCQGHSIYSRVSAYSDAVRQAIADTSDGGDGQAPPSGPPPLRSDGDNDGVPDTVDQCPASPPGPVWLYGEFVGCGYRESPSGGGATIGDQDFDGVPDSADRCPGTPVYAPIYIDGPYAGCAEGQAMDPRGALDPFDRGGADRGAGAFFACDLGGVIPADRECDFIVDCFDASDEAFCF